MLICAGSPFGVPLILRRLGKTNIFFSPSLSRFGQCSNEGPIPRDHSQYINPFMLSVAIACLQVAPNLFSLPREAPPSHAGLCAGWLLVFGAGRKLWLSCFVDEFPFSIKTNTRCFSGLLIIRRKRFWLQQPSSFFRAESGARMRRLCRIWVHSLGPELAICVKVPLG